MPLPNEKHRKIELWDDPEFSVSGQLYSENRLFLHIHPLFEKLTPSLYKRGLIAVKGIRDMAKAVGITHIYCLVPRSLVKWERMLGFSPAAEFENRLEPNGEHIFLMKQEC